MYKEPRSTLKSDALEAGMPTLFSHIHPNNTFKTPFRVVLALQDIGVLFMNTQKMHTSAPSIEYAHPLGRLSWDSQLLKQGQMVDPVYSTVRGLTSSRYCCSKSSCNKQNYYCQALSEKMHRGWGIRKLRQIALMGVKLRRQRVVHGFQN
jgi:hypothetical protein